MSKLLKLKKWFTIPDAAQYLEVVFGEEIGEADVLRFALDGHLTLSVDLVNHAKVKRGKIHSWEETEWELFRPRFGEAQGRFVELMRREKILKEPPKLAAKWENIPAEDRKSYTALLRSDQIDEERYVTFYDEIMTIKGVWDLAMIGSERIFVEQRYQEITEGPRVSLVCLGGAIVKGLEGEIYQIQNLLFPEVRDAWKGLLKKRAKIFMDKNLTPEERDEALKKNSSQTEKQKERWETYSPADLPDDSPLVVRTEAIQEFVQSIDPLLGGQEKPFGTTERNSMLIVIAALCNHSRIRYQERGAARKIAQMTEEIGAVVTDDTVRKMLEKIPDALEARMK